MKSSLRTPTSTETGPTAATAATARTPPLTETAPTFGPTEGKEGMVKSLVWWN